MGVNLNLILPNDCHDIHDNTLATKVFNQAIQKITEYFGGRKGFVEDIFIHNSDSPDWESDEKYQDREEYSFEFPLTNSTFCLRQGYWNIWMFSRYSHYFWPYSIDINGHIRFWPRDDTFETAQAFGYSEGWICDDEHSWNSVLDEDPEASFEKWLTYGENEEDAKVYEFDLSSFNGSMENDYDYRSKYHDAFKECHALAATLARQHPDYRLLTLSSPTERFVLAEKDKDLYVLDLATSKTLTPFPIDCCHGKFNGAGFTLFKGEKQAFFNKEGKQLTDFREGGFSWKWSGVDQSRIVLIDEASGRRFFEDGSDAPF